MTRFVALLRAVNVGGTGKLSMSDLKSLCLDAGFSRVETYIASGNVIFESEGEAAEAKAMLEARLLTLANRPIDVVVRTAHEMAAILVANPFRSADPKLSYVIFLNDPPPPDASRDVVGRGDEELHLGDREIFVLYPGGMGRSKLRIPAAKSGTARNLNTVAKLVEIALRP
jgi:uncharacterized protein (DUF1697 family)